MNQTKLIVTYFKLNEQERTESYLCGSVGDILKNRKLAVGYAHIALLNDDGTVSAHGDNSRGQCNVEEWRDITDIFADKGFTVGVTADGKIMTTHEAKTAPQQKVPASSASVPTKAGQMYDQTEKPVTGVYNGFEYVITGGKASITKYKGKAKTVVIPEVIDGIPVRSIGKKAFYKKHKISALVLSENLKYIGDDAFLRCKKLSKIEMPYGVETIGKNAFGSCGIEELILPESVKTIGDSAFYDNFSLGKLVMPYGVETIGNNAFESCAIEELILPESVKTIGDSAFYLNSKLRKLVMPYGVETIGKKAFECCGIEELILPESLKTIGDLAFSFNFSLRKLVMPYGVETIGYNAFGNCGIEELILPESVKTIGESAFYKNVSLRKVVIPDSVETIGYSAFPTKARNLTEISVETKKRLKNYDYIFEF